MKKVFLITEFGSPFPWTDQYIKNCGTLGKYDWYWKIFTPNKYENVPENVEIVDMTAEQYGELVLNKLGVKTNIFISPKGIPSVHMTDFYIFSGKVFEDYTKGFDFWGITNMDVVYGRLDHFLPDNVLENCDVFTDDVGVINGVFCLWRNNFEINNIYKLIPNWRDVIGQKPCAGCMGEGQHFIFASDEIMMTNVLKEIKNQIKYAHPLYYPLSSHDRLEIHVPEPKLKMQADGSLWELIADTKNKDWEHYIPYFGREVLYYHFQDTKNYPNV